MGKFRNFFRKIKFSCLVILHEQIKNYLLNNYLIYCCVVDDRSRYFKVRYYFDHDMSPYDENSTPRFADIHDTYFYKPNIKLLDESHHKIEKNGKKYYWRKENIH